MDTTESLPTKISNASDKLFKKAYQELCTDNDKVFSLLLVLQWIAVVVVALLVTPRTWIGETSEVNIHVYAAIAIGGMLTIFPVYLNWSQPGAVMNRYVNVIAQGLYSALLIHLTGGRIETHFHVFGSLAFFAFYRDIRVLLVGTLIVAVDHALRGVFLPQSVFGVFTESNWRWVEHAGWVLFEDFFLGYACIRGMKEMRAIAQSRAEIMAQHESAEDLVQKRTFELREERNELQKRNSTIETIYTNVKSGFLLVDENMTIQEGFTQSCVTLLGREAKVGKNLSELLSLNSRAGEHFQLMVEQVFEDILPEEVSLGEIPERHIVGERVVKIEGAVVRDSKGKSLNILFTINDITDLRRTEIQNASNVTIIKILQQRDAFCQFVLDVKENVSECKALLESEKDQRRLRFLLHSMKGNSSVFGLDGIVELIHEIEDHTSIFEKDVYAIENGFKSFLRENFEILNLQYDGDFDENYSINKHMLGQLAVKTQNKNRKTEDLVTEVSKWIHRVQLKPAGELFNPLAKMGMSIATRLEKTVEVRLENASQLIDGDLLRPVIQNATHLIRNSIDHGIEQPHLRGTKPKTGLVLISIQELNDTWVIQVKDDGRGINIDALCNAAIKKGIVTAADIEQMSNQQRIALIFKDGLSTSDHVTQFSGRGVGMSAVADAVKRVGGTIDIESTLGLGTTCTIHVPIIREAQVYTDKTSSLPTVKYAV